MAQLLGRNLPRPDPSADETPRMSLRARILLLLLAVILAVGTMGAMVFVAIGRTDFLLERVEIAHQQLEAMTQLAAATHRYSEDVAEALLLGEQRRPEMETARARLSAGLAELDRVTGAEIAFLQQRAGGAGEEPEEFGKLDRLRVLYASLDRAADRLFALVAEGQHELAVAAFTTEIETEIQPGLEAILSQAIQDERAEVAAAEEEASRLFADLKRSLAVAALVGLFVAIGGALLLSRGLSRSVRRLMEGAGAFARGDLSHRIAVAGGDELALLSQRFNEMAQQIEDQQRRLLLAKDSLQAEVGARTADLEKVNARLKQLDSSRVQFLADISHELRTPLTIMRGEAEVMLRARRLTLGQMREALETVVRQVADMSRLVDDLLFLARSESGTLRFDAAPLALQTVVAEALAEADVLADGRGVRLDRRWPDDAILVQADRQRLKQVVMILVDNAIKHSQVAARVQVDVQDGACARVTVADDGPGIAQADLPYIFERFYRGKPDGGDLAGHGLGLPIAKWIAEKHGGNILVASGAGRGAAFTLQLPLETEAAP